MKDKVYAIFHKTKLIAMGKANIKQVNAWEKLGYTVLRAI